MTRGPATLDRAGVAARVPHGGAMCLLDGLLWWTADAIMCRAGDTAAAHHPLRLHGVLPAASAIEYASQAMALHGNLCAAEGAAPRPGFLASARGVRFFVERLDDAPRPLSVHATRVAGDAGHAMYRFELLDALGALLVDGRATVVLDTALAAAPPGVQPP